MQFGQVNALAVLVSALASMVVGFVWYSRPLFEGAWLAGIGKTREQVAAAPPTRFVIAFIAAVLEAYLLAALLNITGGPRPSTGVLMAVVLWVSLVASTTAASYAFAGRGLRVWLIESGNHLATLLVMGLILGLWT
jgi:hypothetical protein